MISREQDELATSVENPDTVFDRVISPLSRDSFLSELWGKSFLRLTGQRGRFAPLLPWSELNSILEQHRLGSPRLKLVHEGKPIDPDRFQALQNGVLAVVPASLIKLLSEGATLILSSVDELAPAVRQLAESFVEILHAETTVNVYAGWRTQKGFDLHWDRQDTMILQLSGRKHWKVYRPTRLHPFDKDVRDAPKPTEEPVWDGVLEDGDLLYLPRGWWHVAFPLDEPSLHLTITIVPANGIDLLRWIVNRSKRHAEVRMNVPNLANEADRKAYLAKLRGLVMESFTDDVLDRFLAEWEAKIPLRPQMRLPFAPIEYRAPIAMETQVRLATARRLVFSLPADGDKVSFAVGDIRCECSSDLVPALEGLLGTASRSVRELCAQLPDQGSTQKLVVVLTALAMKGALWIEGTQDKER